MIALHTARYKFCRKEATLKMTPAMAAEVPGRALEPRPADGGNGGLIGSGDFRKGVAARSSGIRLEGQPMRRPRLRIWMVMALVALVGVSAGLLVRRDSLLKVADRHISITGKFAHENDRTRARSPPGEQNGDDPRTHLSSGANPSAAEEMRAAFQKLRREEHRHVALLAEEIQKRAARLSVASNRTRSAGSGIATSRMHFHANWEHIKFQFRTPPTLLRLPPR